MGVAGRAGSDGGRPGGGWSQCGWNRPSRKREPFVHSLAPVCTVCEGTQACLSWWSLTGGGRGFLGITSPARGEPPGRGLTCTGVRGLQRPLGGGKSYRDSVLV